MVLYSFGHDVEASCLGERDDRPNDGVVGVEDLTDLGKSYVSSFAMGAKTIRCERHADPPGCLLVDAFKEHCCPDRLIRRGS